MDPCIRAMLEKLGRETGEDFTSYSTSVTAGIVCRRIEFLNLPGPDEYCRYLEGNTIEQGNLSRLLRVRYSAFFRDLLHFELVKAVILPYLLSISDTSSPVPFRAWSCACASGEEVWSLAMILDEALSAARAAVPFHIFGSDISDEAIQEASRGVYTSDSLKNVTMERLESNFSVETDPQGTRFFSVTPRFRSKVSFSRYDMLDRGTFSPPECIFGGFDLVLCRNFTMYLDPSVRTFVFEKLLRSLNSGGILMLGATESPPDGSSKNWEKVCEYGCFYRKAV